MMYEIINFADYIYNLNSDATHFLQNVSALKIASL